MPLDERWYMHQPNCNCPECSAHKTRTKPKITKTEYSCPACQDKFRGLIDVLNKKRYCSDCGTELKELRR